MTSLEEIALTYKQFLLQIMIKLLECGMKVARRVVEKRLCRKVTVDEMQFGFMPERGTIDAVFILRRLLEEYRAKRIKLYMCFLNMQKAIDRVPRRVLEWVVRKKGMPEVLVRSVMSLYEGAKQESEWILSY